MFFNIEFKMFSWITLTTEFIFLLLIIIKFAQTIEVNTVEYLPE